MNPSNYPYLIAIDPSLVCTGISVFTEDGRLMHSTKIKTTTQLETTERYKALVEGFLYWLTQFPNCVLVTESQYIGRMSQFKTVLITPTIKGMFIGVYIANCLARKLTPRILEVRTSEAKKKIGIKGTHKRKENKKAIKEKVQELYPKLNLKSQDEIDSIMIGIAGTMAWELEKKRFIK